MNDPTPTDGVGLRHLFAREDDDVTAAVDDVIGFQFNGDFEFSFDDLTFADNLLLDPNLDPDPVSLNLSSDIGSNSMSNSPGIGSNYDGYSGNCCDRDSCLCLLIDDDDNRSGNLINCDCDSVSRRKLIENGVINGISDGINRNSDVINRNSEEINRKSDEIDEIDRNSEEINRNSDEIDEIDRNSEEINRNSEEISSSGSGSDCMSKSELDRVAEIRIGREIVSESKPDRAEENRSGSGSDCVSESKPDCAEEIRRGTGSGSDCVSELKPDRVEENRRGIEFVAKLRPVRVAENRSRKVEVERDGASSENSSECVSKAKRKIEVERDDGGEIRVRKFRRAEMSEVVSVSVNEESVEGGDDEKRKARLIRNRESAQLSRQRKKQYVEELEDKVRAMHSTITDLNGKISYFMSENATLRQQLSSGVAAAAPGMPPPPPGMYPPHPMAYPWMPYPPAYMVKPQGSQVPLVPIPRLKPQNPVSAPKVKKSSDGKKEKEREKSGRKTKKVASVSLFGILFFMLLFGGLMPMVSVRYGRVRDDVSGAQTGAVFTVDKHEEKVGHVDGKFGHGRVLQEFNNSTAGNNSVPLVASLYVPRNDKLVKIDGNLIIHSILSSEKAMASQKAEGTKTSEETGLAIHGSYPPYPTPGPGSNKWRRPHLDRNQNGRQRALGPGSADFTPIGSDGKIQQWFREGLAEPMLSSGMCTEVFQFDVSPTPGSIVPATSVANITSEDRLNSTRPNIPKNRRILAGHAIPFTDHTLNTTEEHMRSHKQNDGLESNKSRSSVVVSVLVDPREVGDGGDGEGVLGSKTLPRIFVVVLIDSVKYVTYSCMLPFMGSGSHLITA